MRLALIAAAAAAALVPLGPASAQSWQPLGPADPFPPTGTRYCAEGGGDRICLALFCPGAGNGLRLGYVNTTYPPDWTGDAVTLTVDRRLDNILGAPAPTSMMERVERFPYFVMTGMIAPDQAAPLLEAMKRGNRVSVTYGSDQWELSLRGSAREIARAEALCGPPARPPAPAGPEPAAQATPDPEAQAAPPPAAPDVPYRPAIALDAAAWAPVPPDSSEDVFGTRLCWPGRPGAEPERCLALQCYAPGDGISVLYTDTGTGGVFQPGTPFPTILSSGGAAVALDWSVGESRDLVAAWLPGADDWPGLVGVLDGRDPLRIDMPYGSVTVPHDGLGAELARIGAICDVPAADPAPVPEPPAAPDAASFGPLALTPGPLEALPPQLAALVTDARGEAMDAYVETFGELPGEIRAASYPGPGADVLLFTQLCGRGGWFGAKGCMLFVDYRQGGTWRAAFADGEILDPAGMLMILPGGASWPEIDIPHGPVRWVHDGTGYGIQR